MPDKTRAQLHQELAHAEIRVAAAVQEAQQAAEDSERERANRDPEAVAFERCSQALGLLQHFDRGRSTQGAAGYDLTSSVASNFERLSPVGRVLGYLGARFGVEPPTVTEVMLLQRKLQASEAERDQLRYRLSQVEGALASSGADVQGWQR